jgi:single-strand DNA-binding protein
MSNFNQVILMGRLTRDPEIRYTPKGTAIAKFGIAINRKWNSDGGEKKEEVTYVDIDAFGKQAETIGSNLKKGSPIHMVGRLKTDSWDDKATGQKRTKLTVTLDSFQFVGKSEGQTATAQNELPPSDRPASPASEAGTDDNDPVPF